MVDYNEKGREASVGLLASGESFVHAVAVDRASPLAAMFGPIGMVAMGLFQSKSGLPFATSNVAVLTDRRLIVLPRRGRSVGAQPRGSVALSDIKTMRTGKFGRRPLLFVAPVDGKELRLMTVSSDPEPFVAAFEAGVPV